MSFHLGKPILVMLIIAVITGAVALTRPNQKKADLTLWVFADSHYKTLEKLVPAFRDRTGLSVNLNLVSGQAMDLRMSSLFMTNPTSEQLPELVEIEIGWVGKYFRPPIDEIGLIPLNDMLKESGWYDKIIQSRFAPWTKEDVIFGIPHDVHPVTLTYRDDLYREAGIDLSTVKTWPELHEACLKFQDYWRGRGFRERHAIEASTGDSGFIQQILLQRHINLVDQYNKVHINDPRVAQTVAFYTQMVAGPRAVGGVSSGAAGAPLSKDLDDGNLCAFITADWRISYIKQYGKQIGGKLRMMPLPKFDPTDSPTSTWGGSMMGITKACKRPKDAFKLIEYLYFSKEGLEMRQESTDIIPPLKSVWDWPVYQQPDPFFGGQKAQAMFVDLAGQIPERYTTPASTIAGMSLTFVLTEAVTYVQDHGTVGLEAECQRMLDIAAKDLERRVAHWKVD
jgi:arabinosaccharide transport system substrate-binding protein